MHGTSIKVIEDNTENLMRDDSFQFYKPQAPFEAPSEGKII